MGHELVIRGGKIVDGTGADPFIGDIAVDDGAITAIGKIDAQGTKEIDASGHIVTPGFIDAHTHLDAQIAWDPMVTPSSNHGVTTVLLGNCGVTFAPCKPEDRAFLAGMMETVEDIPKKTIMAGLPWDWEHYGEYLSSIERSKPAINVAGLIGHCAVRYYVMGARAVEELATDAEIDQMAGIVEDAMKAGAVGFSTSRVSAHRIPDGRPVPGTFAAEEELLRIAEVVKKRKGGGLMQMVLGVEGDADKVMKLLHKVGSVGGNRLLTNVSIGRKPEDGKIMHERFAAVNADGIDLTGGCIPRGSGFLTGLVNALPCATPAWKRLGARDLTGRLDVLDDPAAFTELVDEAHEAGKFTNPKALYWLGDGAFPDYTAGVENSLHVLAQVAGEHPMETFLRLCRDSRGKAMFTLRVFNGNLDALTDWMKGAHCLPGLGDAGAHVGQVMDAGWATFMLSYWIRDSGTYSLQEGIRRMTSEPARIIGIADRGTLKVGKRADINVINLERVNEHFPEFVHDFPEGAGRYIQKAQGYRATICNGAIILENDKHTGARAGNVLR